MKNRFWLACLTVVLTGCTTVSSSISDGNFKYVTNDVVVEPYFSNYRITTLLDVEGQRVKAEVSATDCEKNIGSLRIEGKKYEDRYSVNVAQAGTKKEDNIFNYLCSKGLPVAYEMENRLTESDKQARAEGVRAAVNFLIQTAPTPRPVYVAPPVVVPQRNQDVRCITTDYQGGAYTRCSPQ